jgi:hypothetical protein
MQNNLVNLLKRPTNNEGRRELVEKRVENLKKWFIVQKRVLKQCLIEKEVHTSSNTMLRS